MTVMPSPRRVFLVVLVAALLLQTAWILALPAFRGADEFDHVYKAEAVAHGELFERPGVRTRRGGLVAVPRDVVEAASRMCESYPYTLRQNCHPVEDLGGGLVSVASGASSYQPAYYATVGLLARPFGGAGADFAMRSLTAAIAALLLAWAAATTAGWARDAWPLLALSVATTPVLVYSTAVASPNGITYAAACLLWAAGVGLVVHPGRPRLVALGAAAVVMMATHSTGLLWVPLVVAALAVLQSRDAWRALWVRHRGRLRRTAVAVGAGAASSVVWILVARTNALTAASQTSPAPGLGQAIGYQFTWVLQTVGAFPMPNEPAPVAVYVLWLVLFAALMGAAVRQADRRLRVALALLLTAWLAVPAALSVVAFPSEGMAWQGRYALPLALGFPALAGLALTRTGRAPSPRVVFGTVMMTAAAHAISSTVVAWRDDAGVHYAPSFASSVPGGIAVIAVLALLGGVLPLVLALGRRSERVGTGSGSLVLQDAG